MAAGPTATIEMAVAHILIYEVMAHVVAPLDNSGDVHSGDVHC